MAKITHEQLSAEVQAKGYKLIDDSNYQNLESTITIECSKGHKIETNLKTFRHQSFICPICDGGIKFEKPRNVPDKAPSSFRIVAFDQATEKCGFSIWDDGKLVYYDLLVFSGDLISRIAKFRSVLEDIVIPYWKPDFLVFEDIQYQRNIMTFKVLSMLLGVAQVSARSKGIDFDIVLPTVWRSGLGAGYAGKTRAEEKMLAKKKVKELYDVDVSDDIAEAVLIGKYAARRVGKKAF